MPKVTFLPANKVVEVAEGKTILQAAIEAGVRVESTCGGKGTCGKCKVHTDAVHLSPISRVEERFLSSTELEAGWVLACQRHLKEDIIVTLEEQKDAFVRKTAFNQTETRVPLAPSVRKYYIEMTPPTVEDQMPDWDRLLMSLDQREIPFNRRLATSLPQTLRQANFKVTAVVNGSDLLAVEPGDTRDRCFGLAIDIGTTTVVAYLMDLNHGSVIGNAAVTNPQNVFGADVISRINHAATGPEALRQLQEKVISGLNTLITRLASENQVLLQEIYLATVVGNTTMSHLFLGVDPSYLAPAPFIPVFRQLVEVDAAELGLDMLGNGKVVVLPNVAGYVGSDTVGVAVASNIDRIDGITLAIDIGTNGEMILAGKDRILTCSTAAGPAFEGAEIKCGMRAAEGAIEGVHINEDVELAIIADSKARGICGSGLIDVISEMARTGVIDASGRMAYKPEQLERLPICVRDRLRQGDHGKEFVLVWGRDSASGEDIVLTQKDIRELQLAKGAILAGIKVLMAELGIEANEIDRVMLAGAFGNFIKKESALGIKLLPQLPVEKISAIGNAAGDGAKMALLSAQEREHAVHFALRAEHIELSNTKGFQDEFIDSLSF